MRSRRSDERGGIGTGEGELWEFRVGREERVFREGEVRKVELSKGKKSRRGGGVGEGKYGW